MNRKNTALLAVMLVSAAAIVTGVRMAAPTSRDAAPVTPPTGSSAGPDDRPSPIAESVDIVKRNRRKAEPRPAAAPQAESNRARSANDGTKDWSVVAATLNSAEAAGRRAQSLKGTWRDCACSVFPTGQSERYYVVVGSRLDRDSADRLRERATAAGLPGDTYVTKLIQRPGDSAP